MAPPRAAAQSELLMAATQSRLIANPSQACPTRTAVPHGYRKAQKTNTNPFLQKLDAARRCDANPTEKKAA